MNYLPQTNDVCVSWLSCTTYGLSNDWIIEFQKHNSNCKYSAFTLGEKEAAEHFSGALRQEYTTGERKRHVKAGKTTLKSLVTGIGSDLQQVQNLLHIVAQCFINSISELHLSL